jgi:hypothetical protein
MASVTTRRRVPHDQISPLSSPRREVTRSWNISDAAFIATLKSRGVTFTLDGENLRVDAPRGALSDFDRERLWHHMDGVRTVLAGEQRHANALVR